MFSKALVASNIRSKRKVRGDGAIVGPVRVTCHQYWTTLLEGAALRPVLKLEGTHCNTMLENSIRGILCRIAKSLAPCPLYVGIKSVGASSTRCCQAIYALEQNKWNDIKYAGAFCYLIENVALLKRMWTGIKRSMMMIEGSNEGCRTMDSADGNYQGYIHLWTQTNLLKCM